MRTKFCYNSVHAQFFGQYFLIRIIRYLHFFVTSFKVNYKHVANPIHGFIRFTGRGSFRSFVVLNWYTTFFKRLNRLKHIVHDKILPPKACCPSSKDSLKIFRNLKQNFTRMLYSYITSITKFATWLKPSFLSTSKNKNIIIIAFKPTLRFSLEITLLNNIIGVLLSSLIQTKLIVRVFFDHTSYIIKLIWYPIISLSKLIT